MTQDEAELIHDLDVMIAQDGEHWITTESGSHLLIGGTEGEGYTIKGGAGGKLNGQKISPKSMSANRINEKSSAFNSPDFKPHEEAKTQEHPAHKINSLTSVANRENGESAEPAGAKPKSPQKLSGEKSKNIIAAGKKMNMPQYMNVDEKVAQKFGEHVHKHEFTIDPNFTELDARGQKADLIESFVKNGLISEGDNKYKHRLSDVGREITKEIYRLKRSHCKPHEEAKTQEHPAHKINSLTSVANRENGESAEQAKQAAAELNKMGAHNPYLDVPIPSGHERLAIPMKIERETDKAYAVRNQAYHDAKETALYDIKETTQAQRDMLRNGSSLTWFPKSGSHVHNGHLISSWGKLAREKGLETHEGKARQSEYDKKNEERFNAGVQRYNDLIALAKASGVKGVRSGMRTTTIKDKMRAAGVAVDMALDKSLRSYDQDGRMHIASSNISKATVNPYYGREIPNWQGLGLELDKIYYMLRDPQELEKAASTFNNLQLLIKHKPVNAEDSERMITVGTTGSDVVYEHPYLRCSLAVWDKEGIDVIENEEQRELSSAYHYDADMTAGEYEGVHYDGVMRNIKGNHVALVDVGRAGRDVVVSDKDPFFKRNIMSKLKQGAVTRIASMLSKFSGKVAQDGDIDVQDVATIIGALNVEISEAKDELPTPELPTPKLPTPKLPTQGQDEGGIGEFLKGKLSEDDYQTAMDMLKPAGDENPVENPTEDEEPDSPDSGAPKPAQDKGISMDKAIAKAVAQAKSEMRDLSVAQKEVAPLVGEVALDSANDVYKFALEQSGVSVTGVHPSAYRSMVTMLKDKPKNKPAMDGAAVSSLHEKFKGLSRIGKA